ncbi:hypothetical protein EYF80_010551 [Liparis tanakae]|uniref:Uncharacterized protein n=1 Tax=Liparis tanakae TaxID=230148 RepID=A0A4Z2IN50_9TELE|nr:hypothetical protein EYF80_010551 [Liparis tanakae]
MEAYGILFVFGESDPRSLGRCERTTQVSEPVPKREKAKCVRTRTRPSRVARPTGRLSAPNGLIGSLQLHFIEF